MTYARLSLLSKFLLIITINRNYERDMKRNKSFTASRRLRANNQRRTMLKRMHQKVMARRKQFALTELKEEWSQAS